jgi:sulfatase maturation enzyme AslB (radical SAM superfamily)
MEKPGCTSCDVLPLCHGGCPIEGMKDAEADHGACEQFKFHLEPVVELQYQYQAENGEDGPAQGAARGPCK